MLFNTRRAPVAWSRSNSASTGRHHAMRRGTRVGGVVTALLLAAGCGSSSSDFTIATRPTPTPSTVSGETLPKPPAPTDLCTDVACCESQLGIASGECATITLVQGHCALAPAADGTPCGTAVACTQSSVCTAGVCAPSASTVAVDCAGLDGPCAVGSCDPGTGGCVAVPKTGESCDDGDACTESDLCDASGQCLGVAKTCDDGDPCTADSCDPMTGGCSVGASTCSECTTPADCPAISKCQGAYECVDGACQILPDSAACAGLTALPCHVLTCDDAVGECVQTPSATGDACDDGDECTTSDVCDAQGACQGGPATCDDGNPCTADHCTAADGCVHDPQTGTACDDQSACTSDDHCDAGLCGGTSLVCDDDDPCTKDACNPNVGCEHLPDSGPTCDDGDPCTGSDACVDGGCTGAPVFCGCVTDADCPDDGDLCNGVSHCVTGTCELDPASVVVCAVDAAPADCFTPTCDPATGQCASAPVTDGQSCSDANPCTKGDACAAGACVGVSLDCDDGIACTDDTCEPAKGCVSVASTSACDDGDACTTGDTCLNKACVSGAATNCNDGEICTADSCQKKSGCKHSPVSGACNDSSACTSNDMCVSGVCTGEQKACPGSGPCVVGACDAASGQCSLTPKDCDDNDACTNDACDATGTCTHVALTCSAATACEIATCDSSVGCVASPKDCNDGDSCTDDVCDAGTCNHPAVSCDDQNACTADACGANGCAHSAVSCNDNDACTTDTCAAATGCVYTSKSCDDAVACTEDSCNSGACTHTPSALACDDKNACTVDSCDAASGCSYTFAAGGCDDGDACTAGDTCRNGVCKPISYTCGTCANKAEGEGCDDGDGATAGDFCYRGWCRGFESHQVASTATDGALALDHVSITGGVFYAAATETISSSNGSTSTGYIAAVSLDGDLDVLPTTAAPSHAWKATTAGVAVGEGLSVALYQGGTWATSNWITAGLGALNLPEVTSADLNAVWHDSVSDVTFIAGRGTDAGSKPKAWIARCDGGAQVCSLDEVSYGEFGKTEIPRAMTGYSASSPSALMVSDYPASTATNPKYFNDAFFRPGLATGVKWKLDLFETTSDYLRSADVHAVGPTSVFWVGSGGLLRSRVSVDANGTPTWSKLTGLWFGQGSAALSGVWLDERVTLVTNTNPGLGSAVELQLVTHPTTASATSGANWRRIGLGTVQPTGAPCIGSFCLPLGSVAAGLSDVWSDGDNIVLVGWQVPSGKSVKHALILVRRIL